MAGVERGTRVDLGAVAFAGGIPALAGGTGLVMTRPPVLSSYLLVVLVPLVFMAEEVVVQLGPAVLRRRRNLTRTLTALGLGVVLVVIAIA
jgi:hypothetical protein